MCSASRLRQGTSSMVISSMSRARSPASAKASAGEVATRNASLGSVMRRPAPSTRCKRAVDRRRPCLDQLGEAQATPDRGRGGRERQAGKGKIWLGEEQLGLGCLERAERQDAREHHAGAACARPELGGERLRGALGRHVDARRGQRQRIVRRGPRRSLARRRGSARPPWRRTVERARSCTRWARAWPCGRARERVGQERLRSLDDQPPGFVAAATGRVDGGRQVWASQACAVTVACQPADPFGSVAVSVTSPS